MRCALYVKFSTSKCVKRCSALPPRPLPWMRLLQYIDTHEKLRTTQLFSDRVQFYTHKKRPSVSSSNHPFPGVWQMACATNALLNNCQYQLTRIPPLQFFFACSPREWLPFPRKLIEFEQKGLVGKSITILFSEGISEKAIPSIVENWRCFFLFFSFAEFGLITSW